MTKNISSIEKCAKLMGLGIIDGIAPIPTPDGQWREFNPLTNKSDLMDLECALGIDIDWIDFNVAEGFVHANIFVGEEMLKHLELFSDHQTKFTTPQPDIVAELVKALEIYSDRLYEHKDIATAASEIGKILGKCYKEYGIQEAKK